MYFQERCDISLKLVHGVVHVTGYSELTQTGGSVAGTLTSVTHTGESGTSPAPSGSVMNYTSHTRMLHSNTSVHLYANWSTFWAENNTFANTKPTVSRVNNSASIHWSTSNPMTPQLDLVIPSR